MSDELGRALRCEACGGTLPTPEVASVVCPGCGEVTRVDGELLAALREHEGRVGKYRREVEHATEHALGAQMTRKYGGRWAALLVVSWIVAAFVTVPDTAATDVLALMIVVGPFGLMFWHGRRVERGLRADLVAAREREGVVFVACPTCGGQNEFLPDDPVRPCGFCHGTLAADEGSRDAMIAVARDSAQRERWMAIHERWKTAALTHRDARTDLVPFFVIGGLGSLLVIGGVVTGARVLLGLQQTSDTDGFWIMQGLSVAVVMGVGTPLWRRRRRARAWAAALEEGARHSGARVGRRLDDLSAWLVAHWRGELRSTEICGGREYALIASEQAPLWALSIAPFALDEGPVELHLRLFVPGNAEGELVRRFAEAAGELGMTVRLGEGGLVAVRTGAWVKALYAQPKRLEAVTEAIASTWPRARLMR